MVYIGTGHTYTLCGEGRFAICGARATRSLPNRRVAAADVPVELRGAGNCSGRCTTSAPQAFSRPIR